jgi:hypothetical protein
VLGAAVPGHFNRGMVGKSLLALAVLSVWAVARCAQAEPAVSLRDKSVLFIPVFFRIRKLQILLADDSANTDGDAVRLSTELSIPYGCFHGRTASKRGVRR